MIKKLVIVLLLVAMLSPLCAQQKTVSIWGWRA